MISGRFPRFFTDDHQTSLLAPAVRLPAGNCSASARLAYARAHHERSEIHGRHHHTARIGLHWPHDLSHRHPQHRILQRSDGGIVRALRYLSFGVSELHDALAGGAPELYAKVYVIQAALPCITQIAVLAKYHHADVEYATTCVASTTLLAAIALPIWMMILTAIY